MEMTWTQTLTIIISMAGVCAWIWRASKEDDEKIREDMKRHDAEFQEARKLWASLLQKSAEIEKENVVVKQKLLDIENKSSGVEHAIRDLMKKL